LNKLVIASNNPGKLREISAILAPLDIEVVPQGILGVSEAEEPYGTFIENALTKARHASRATGLPALADDSGVCVHALGGEPGVRSARYAGESADDAANRRKLVERLRTLRMDERVAHFVCVLVLATPAGDETTAEGFCHGNLLLEERGSRGFGYDSLFVPEGFDRTFAEMTQPEKAALSHRGRALARLAKSWPR
jgi:XTP/dITP diphosphohydrolase